MAYINKKDTDGNKSLLQEGELGYDKNLAGGDVGRVYVGKGNENVPLAKKSEVDAAQSTADTHISRTDNPHTVTKTQVGLPFVDNTSDLDKPVSTAVQAELDTIQTEVDKNTAVNGTAVDARYDKLLSVRDVIEMLYTDGNLTTVRYAGDNDTNVYYRDILEYDANSNLVLVEHYYNTTGLVTPTANTALTYSGSDLVTATYTE